MTREEMITRWKAKDAATLYLVGFTHRGNLYRVFLQELPDVAIKLNRSSSNAHGKAMQTLRLKLNELAKEELIAQGAELVGSAELVAKEPKLNSGEKFERLMVEQLTGKPWAKDNVPYWEAGDMTWRGEQVQIKFNNATLTTEKALG